MSRYRRAGPIFAEHVTGRLPAVRNVALTALVFAVALAALGCTQTGFHVNPTIMPTRDPGPAPRAEIVSTKSLDELPETGDSGGFNRLPQLNGAGASGPQFKFLVTATPLTLPDGFTLPPGGSLPCGGVYRGSVRVGSPEHMLRQQMQKLQWVTGMSVHSQFYIEEGSDEVFIEADGEYALNWFDPQRPSAFDALVEAQPEFTVKFSRQQADSDDPAVSEIAAHRGRLVTDTTENHLRTYSSNAEWLAARDIGELPPTTALFLSLALSGGRVIENNFNCWIWFNPGEVVESHPQGPDGQQYSLLEGNRVNDAGDTEAWKVWADARSRVTRIELTITSDDPARSLRSVEMDITYTADSVEPDNVAPVIST